jgi:5-methylcytosine-specific restriction endonuclease McrA
MSPLSSLSDSELVARLPRLVQTERHAVADVIEHLVEMERRRLYLSHSASSLYRYCIDVLGYDEDAALKRHRVAKLALRLPQVLAELRAGTLHLTGLFLLAKHLTEENASELLGEARGKSRRKIEELIARWFPRSDVPASIEPSSEPVAELRGGPNGQLLLGGARSPVAGAGPTCSGAGAGAPGRLEPLSPSRVRVQFTARTELYDKLEQARELLSHALPSGDLGELFERALDALIDQETRKRFGVKKPRKPRKLEPGSRHVPVQLERAVWERDGLQCTYVDAEGRRCGERRFLTIEHRMPFALGGPTTLENLCLLCRAHNQESARQVFGEALIDAKIRARKQQAADRAAAISALSHPDRSAGETQKQSPAHERAASEPPQLDVAVRAQAALCQLGFRPSEASAAVGQALGKEPGLDLEQLLRACLLLLVRAAS